MALFSGDCVEETENAIFQTENEIMEIISQHKSTTQVPLNEIPQPYKLQEPLAVMWDDPIAGRNWFVGF